MLATRGWQILHHIGISRISYIQMTKHISEAIQSGFETQDGYEQKSKIVEAVVSRKGWMYSKKFTGRKSCQLIPILMWQDPHPTLRMSCDALISYAHIKLLVFIKDLNPFDVKGVDPIPQTRFGSLGTLKAHNSTTIEFRTPESRALDREFNLRKEFIFGLPPPPKKNP